MLSNRPSKSLPVPRKLKDSLKVLPPLRPQPLLLIKPVTLEIALLQSDNFKGLAARGGGAKRVAGWIEVVALERAPETVGREGQACLGVGLLHVNCGRVQGQGQF
jgi:hypothetical protein